jgi:hypothetical protein
MTIQTIIKLFLSVLGIIAVIVFGLWAFAYLNSIINPTPSPNPKPPDTVYVPIKLPPDPVKVPEIPKVVRIYLPDTNSRKEKEKGDIITDVKASGSTIEITKIDPKGVSTIEVYKVDPDMKSFHIDDKGHLQQKKRTKIGRFLRKAKWYAIGTVVVAGAITVAILL